MTTESTHIDVNGFSVYGQHGVAIQQASIPLAGDGLDSPLKISHSTEITGDSLKIPQGQENAVDMNCVSNVTISNCEFGIGIDNKTSEGQVITVKSSDHVTISGVIHGRPGRQGAHIQLGQHSDQGYQPTKHVTLDVVHADAGPVYLVTGWVLWWTIKRGPSVKWLILPSVELCAYVMLKWCVRLVLRIPKGTKGPSWL